MHRGHDHDFNGGAGSTGTDRRHHGIGHNRGMAPAAAAQWQTPHRDTTHRDQDETQCDADFDKVEAAFIDGFLSAPDPASFLRLADIPFQKATADGRHLVLLRVETETAVDIGSIVPHLGGATFQYNPLPGRLATRRRRIRFVYFDGVRPCSLSFAEARDPKSRETATGVVDSARAAGETGAG